MIAELAGDRVDQWERSRPALGGDFGSDVSGLRDFTGAGERLIGSVPRRPGRDARQQHLADRVLAASRTARDQFISAHADLVYDELTDRRRVYLSLAELADAAAEKFTGLTPTRTQMLAESACAQREKDGREIDQGIFFRGLLRSPTAGRHLMDAMRRPSSRALELSGEFRDRGSAELDTLMVERRGRAAHVTFHNDHCLNAEDNRLIDDMETAVDLALLDGQVGVGVLRGGVMSHPRYRGKRVFSAGLNLAEFRAGRISFVDFLLRRELGYISKMLRGVLTPAGTGPAVHKPWIAAVDSFAIGGGMQLLLVADWVIAAEDAYFSLPAAHEGIVPGVANLRLGRLTGGRLARRIILGGHKIYATAPDALMLCDEVVPTARIDQAVETASQALDNPAVAANRFMLTLAEEPHDLFREYMAEFAFLQAQRMYSEDVLGKIDRGRAASKPRPGSG